MTHVIQSTAPPAGHDCRDCPKRGGTGFDCHHLVRGQRMADRCDWCRERGFEPGQFIPTDGGATS